MVWIPTEARHLSSSIVSRHALRPTQPPILWVPETLSPRVKQPERDTDQSPPCSAKIKNVWIYACMSTYAFLDCTVTDIDRTLYSNMSTSVLQSCLTLYLAQFRKEDKSVSSDPHSEGRSVVSCSLLLSCSGCPTNSVLPTCGLICIPTAACKIYFCVARF